eukprot:8062187-Pyramimonas_sp.AAC.1
MEAWQGLRGPFSALLEASPRDLAQRCAARGPRGPRLRRPVFAHRLGLWSGPAGAPACTAPAPREHTP